MATKQIIKPAQSPAAVGPYSHAVRIGDFIFFAGQIPIDKDGCLVDGDKFACKPNACCKM